MYDNNLSEIFVLFQSIHLIYKAPIKKIQWRIYCTNIIGVLLKLKHINTILTTFVHVI